MEQLSILLPNGRVLDWRVLVPVLLVLVLRIASSYQPVPVLLVVLLLLSLHLWTN